MTSHRASTCSAFISEHHAGMPKLGRSSPPKSNAQQAQPVVIAPASSSTTSDLANLRYLLGKSSCKIVCKTRTLEYAKPWADCLFNPRVKSQQAKATNSPPAGNKIFLAFYIKLICFLENMQAILQCQLTFQTNKPTKQLNTE